MSTSIPPNGALPIPVLPGQEAGSTRPSDLQAQLETSFQKDRGHSRKDLFKTIAEGLKEGAFGGVIVTGPVASGMLRILTRFGWNGTVDHFARAMPHFPAQFGLDEMREVLVRLGFPSRVWVGDTSTLDSRVLPALLQCENGSLVLVDKAKDGSLSYLDLEKGELVTLAQGLCYGPMLVFTQEDAEALKTQPDGPWFGTFLRRFRGPFALLFMVTFIINTFMLIASFAVMAIYDIVIPAKAQDTLLFILAGVLAFFAFEVALRGVKAIAIGHLAARLEYALATTIFSKLISFPLEMTASAPIGSQISRIRQFESVRDLFAGPFVSIALEIPFIVVFIGALFIFAGWLGFLPIVMIVLYSLIGGALVPVLRRRSLVSAQARSERQALFLDTVSNIRTIRAVGCENMWLERIRNSSAQTCLAQYRSTQISNLLLTFSNAGVPIAGIATITAGSVMVMNNTLSMGALIATMIIVWRIMAPVQQALVTLSRLNDMTANARQIDQVMRLKGETEGEDPPLRRHFTGALSFNRVILRYPRSPDMALAGISFEAPAGSLIAVMGPSGSGKSTLMRAILNLFPVQSGAVSIDGINVRQMRMSELRSSIAYLPQSPALFHGSIAQNLRLTASDATQADLDRVCRDLGILSTIDLMPKGFETLLTDIEKEQHSSGFRQALGIAQALLRRSQILLLDEPAQALDPDVEQNFIRIIQKLKRHQTIIMVTHRPSHAAFADRVLVMEKGQVARFEAPESIFSSQNKGGSHAA